MKLSLLAFTSVLALTMGGAAAAQTASAASDQTGSAGNQDPATSAVGSDDSAPQSGAPQAGAAARGDDNEVQAVVITARKTEELLRDIPIAATVVDQTAINDQGGIRTMEDLLANAPAVHFLNTSSPVNSEVTIRGSGTSRGTNAEAAVGLYRNGAYIGGGTLGGRAFSRWDLFDLERAEVLRGTQGALYGRNAVGGAINVISQRPIFEQDAELFLQYATNDYKQVDFIYNAPITENLAFRVSLSGVDQSEGFFYNPVRGEYFDAQETFGMRGQLRYRAGRFDGTLLAEHYQGTLQAVTFQVIIPAGTSPGFPRGYIQDEFEFPRNGPTTAKQQLNSIQGYFNYDLGFAQLNSSTMYRVRRTLFAFDRDAVSPEELARVRRELGGGATTDPNVNGVNSDETTLFFQDLHLTGEFGPRTNWLTGVEFLNIESQSQSLVTRTPTRPNPSPGNFAPALLDIRSWAVYGLVGFDVTDTVNVTGEARYTKDERSIDIERRDLATNAIINPARFSVSGTNSPEDISYTLSAGWKFAPTWLLYGKVGTAFRAGNFNTDLGDPRGLDIPVAYDDENSTTYEAGLKGNFTPALYTALTAYQINTTDALVQRDNGCQTSNPACPVIPTNFLENGGDTEIRGLELEGTYRTELFGGRLRLNGGVTRQSGEFTAGPDQGEQIPRLPEWTVKGNLNYLHALTARMDGFFNIRYDGEWGGTQEIEPQIPVPFSRPQILLVPELDDRSLIDFRIGVRQGGAEFAFFAENALDEEYVIFKGPSTIRRNLPRRVGVQFRYDF